MRTIELHAPLEPIQRSKGRSSVAAAAYRAAERIHDERTGITHDFTRKRGVEHVQIYLPDHALDGADDRAKLWNAVEAKENRKNSCTAYEWEIAFIAEFTKDQRLEAGDKIAHEIMERYGCAVDIAYHEPSKDGDQRNYHAHIMFTTRGFDPETKDGWQVKKIRELSQDRVEVDGEMTTQGKQQTKEMREFIATRMNEIAARDGIDVHVEHLSFEERGIDREPEIHLGATASQMEREGKDSERGEKLREIWERNAERAHLADQQERVELEIAQERMRQIEQERQQFDTLYETQRQQIEQERQQYQEQIDELSSQLEGRSRFAVLWDKLRGRLGWHAEQELAAAQRAAGEAEERKRVLEVSYAQQMQRESDDRAKQEHTRQQHTDMALGEMERDAMSKNPDRNKAISTLEAWDASGTMKMAEQHHAEAQSRGMTGRQLSALQEAERSNPATPHLEAQPEHKSRASQESHDERIEHYKGIFQAAREQAEQEREIDDSSREMDIE